MNFCFALYVHFVIASGYSDSEKRLCNWDGLLIIFKKNIISEKNLDTDMTH